MARSVPTVWVVLLPTLLLLTVRTAARIDDFEIPARIDFDEATRAAERIPNAFLRGRFLFEAGMARARAGDHAAALAHFRRGTEQIRKAIDSRKDEGGKGYLYVHVAALQHRAGDRAAAGASFARAVEIAKALPHEKEGQKADLLQFVARTQAEVGEFAGALDTARGLFSSDLEIFVLEDIAIAQARAGDVPGALCTAAKVRALGGRAKTRRKADPSVVACHELVYAEMLAQAALARANGAGPGAADARKMIEEALRLTDRSLNLRADVGASTLVRIALAQAKLGETAQSRRTLTRALGVADHIEGFQRPELMAKIAEAHWKAGQIVEAREILRHALDRVRPLEKQFPQVDNAIIQVQIEVGDVDGALETARASHREPNELVLYPEVFRQLVHARARTIGPRSAVEEWWNRVKSPLLRAYAILGAAEAATIPEPARKP
ncbi:MAG: hypothetical protein ACYC61_01780 [Isosphaeraceae bacterium]